MATEAPGRVRRSIRFAQLEAEAGPAIRDSSPRRERMTGTEKLEMPSFQNTQDWTGGMGMSPSGRFQVVEEPKAKPKPLGRSGIRQDWARAIIWIMAAVMSVVLLVEIASVGASALSIQKLSRRIDAAESRGLELESELSSLSGDISVCTRAVELNLISSNGATTIQLRAPEAATMTLVQTQQATATEEPEMRAALTNTD